ncbi:hypothetical protein A4E84_03825 [Streptomyces qaidamensis]|uniref:Uncharacterized protein n=1 Tax=Streptomyces qaidamensis TaxID=1783515 RepID=A0A143BUB0_9ACTN|nr:hypothetical protein A4E84_03825 [Streptomyces qaidamensis]
MGGAQQCEPVRRLPRLGGAALPERGRRGGAVQHLAEPGELSAGVELLDAGRHLGLLRRLDLDVRDDHDGAQRGDEVQDADSFDLVGVLAQLGAGGVAGDRLADVRGDGEDDQGAVQGVDLRLAGDVLPAASRRSRRRLYGRGGGRAPTASGDGRALRDLPEQQLRLELGGHSLFEVLDAERIDEEALKVVQSIEDELRERAVAAYEDLLRGH